MINLNKLAIQARKRYLECRLMTCDTSDKAKVLRISSSWRRLFSANKYPAKEMPKYTSEEIAAADIILDTLEYLETLKKRRILRMDIEDLLRDRLENLEEE